MLKPYAGILLDEYTDGEILTDPKKRQALLIKAIYDMDGLDLSGMLEVLRHAERNAALLEAAATKLPDDGPLKFHVLQDAEKIYSGLGNSMAHKILKQYGGSSE